MSARERRESRPLTHHMHAAQTGKDALSMLLKTVDGLYREGQALALSADRWRRDRTAPERSDVLVRHLQAATAASDALTVALAVLAEAAEQVDLPSFGAPPACGCDDAAE